MDIYQALSFLMGFVVGVAVVILYIRRKNKKNSISVGTLRIDESDPDGPYLFLELDSGLNDIYGKNEVVFKVQRENILTQ